MNTDSIGFISSDSKIIRTMKNTTIGKAKLDPTKLEAGPVASTVKQPINIPPIKPAIIFGNSEGFAPTIKYDDQLIKGSQIALILKY